MIITIAFFMFDCVVYVAVLSLGMAGMASGEWTGPLCSVIAGLMLRPMYTRWMRIWERPAPSTGSTSS